MGVFSGKTYWLVGASEGLGRALAVQMAHEGAELILSARNPQRLQGLAQQTGNARVLPLDVTDADAVEQAALAAGPVDGLIYCAGLYEPMTAQGWKPREALQIGDVNYAGAMRVLGAVVPEMIERDAGHIVVIGSLAGYRGLPGAIGYGSSKAAVMSLTESLYADTRGTGVRVQLANPGFIRTRLTDKNGFAMPFLMTPETAAAHVVRLMRGSRFRSDFPRPFSWLFSLGRFLPNALFYRIFRSA